MSPVKSSSWLLNMPILNGRKPAVVGMPSARPAGWPPGPSLHQAHTCRHNSEIGHARSISPPVQCRGRRVVGRGLRIAQPSKSTGEETTESRNATASHRRSCSPSPTYRHFRCQVSRVSTRSRLLQTGPRRFESSCALPRTSNGRKPQRLRVPTVVLSGLRSISPDFVSRIPVAAGRAGRAGCRRAG